MLPLSSELIVAELEAAKTVLQKWLETFQEGLPQIDRPGTGQELDLLVRQFCGELRVVSGKCDTLSEVLTEALP